MSTGNKYNPSQVHNTRDWKGRPLYLSRLPLWKRYPKTIIFGGGCLVSLIPFAKAIYDAIFLKPEDVPYQADWWPGEINRGKRYIDTFRERHVEQKRMLEEYEQQQALIKEAQAAAKQQK